MVLVLPSLFRVQAVSPGVMRLRDVSDGLQVELAGAEYRQGIDLDEAAWRRHEQVRETHPLQRDTEFAGALGERRMYDDEPLTATTVGHRCDHGSKLLLAAADGAAQSLFDSDVGHHLAADLGKAAQTPLNMKKTVGVEAADITRRKPAVVGAFAGGLPSVLKVIVFVGLTCDGDSGVGRNGNAIGVAAEAEAQERHLVVAPHREGMPDDMAEVAAYNRETGREMLHCVDFDGELYIRQERGGMLIGTYERDCRPWSERVTPWEFGHELLEPDLDRIAPSLEGAFRHFPAFERAGIKQIINGPFTFAPDGNPLVGPIRGLKNYWVACGVMAGLSQGGGVGLTLANWITEGDPGFDVFAMDVARYGDFATRAYTNARVRETYARRFSIRFPNEERPAGRPLATTPPNIDSPAADSSRGNGSE